MGAYAEDTGHFYHWLQQNESLWRNLDSSFQNLEINPNAFFPRMIYGKYLETIWEESLALAKKKNIQVNIIRQEVVNILVQSDKKLKIIFVSGQDLKTDYAVLTIGVPSNKKVLFKGNSEKNSLYFPNIWEYPLNNLKTHSKVAIIGSGLTMVDAFLSLIKRNFKGEIIVISRKALSESHISNEQTYPEFILDNTPKTSLQLLQRIRNEVNNAVRKGYHWIDVMNSLRPHTTTIWRDLSWEERKKAFRHFLGLFLRLRHRVPQEGIEIIRDQQSKGLIKIKRASVDSIEEKGNKVIVNYRNSDSTHQIEVDYAINCCGPNLKITRTDSELLQNLLKNKLITPDPLGLGIKASLHGCVEGKETNKLYVIGLLLFGERLETIAVPELRQQCSDVASQILEN